MITTYRAYGLSIASDLKLPQLTEDPDCGTTDVVVRRDDLEEVSHILSVDTPFVAAVRDRDILLSWRSYGHFLVRDGKEILYLPPLNGDTGALAAPLIGVVLGVLLHQRGVLTLHSSAINFFGNGVAFIAHKGTGKSTTCASMYNRGYPLITDDVLAIQFQAGGEPMVEPAYPTLKLHPDSVESIGKDPRRLNKIAKEIDKRYLIASSQFDTTSLPLRTVYLLENGDEYEVSEINSKEAFLHLLEHSFVVRTLGRIAAGKQHFLDCERVVKNVKIKRLVRPRDLSKLDEYLDFIESDLEAEFAAAQAIS